MINELQYQYFNGLNKKYIFYIIELIHTELFTFDNLPIFVQLLNRKNKYAFSTMWKYGFFLAINYGSILHTILDFPSNLN